MKETDLRIGNYVTRKQSENKALWKVIAITEFFINLELIGFDTLIQADINDIEPVILDSFYLSTLGLDNNTNLSCEQKNIYCILEKDIQGYVVYISDYKKNINYVHELQNLFYSLFEKELIFKYDKKNRNRNYWK